MLTLRPKFLLAAALLATTAALPAASFFPTSPLIQLGQDTDIFFDASASFNITDNLYSGTNKTSATYYTIAPGFSLEYAKDSPFYVTASISRSQLYYGSLSKLNNTQDNLDGAVFIDQGGPLKAVLRSYYHESARNDNLTALGIDGEAVGETLVRQGDYFHSLKLDYRLTEKIFLGMTLTNKYNRYLNPITIADSVNTGEFVYNTNTLSEINSKSVDLVVTYNPPGDLITYGLSYGHTLNDFNPAPFLSTHGDSRVEGIYKSTQDNFFLTASGNLTRSGKLGLSANVGTSSSKTFNKTGGDTTTNGLSYSLSLKHNLTELINHEFSIGRSVSPTPSGDNNLSKTYGYAASYAATDSLSLNLHINRAEAGVVQQKINTMEYGLGAFYNYNSHLNFNAALTVGDTKFPQDGTKDYQTKSFLMRATFRY